MNNETNIKKLNELIEYAWSLGLRMDFDWAGDENDEEYVGVFISERTADTDHLSCG